MPGRRVPLTGEDRLEDGHAGHAGDVADDLLELEVHLREGLLHVLDMLPA